MAYLIPLKVAVVVVVLVLLVVVVKVMLAHYVNNSHQHGKQESESYAFVYITCILPSLHNVSTFLGLLHFCTRGIFDENMWRCMPVFSHYHTTIVKLPTSLDL